MRQFNFFADTPQESKCNSSPSLGPPQNQPQAIKTSCNLYFFSSALCQSSCLFTLQTLEWELPQCHSQSLGWDLGCGHFRATDHNNYVMSCMRAGLLFYLFSQHCIQSTPPTKHSLYMHSSLYYCTVLKTHACFWIYPFMPLTMHSKGALVLQKKPGLVCMVKSAVKQMSECFLLLHGAGSCRTREKPLPPSQTSTLHMALTEIAGAPSCISVTSSVHWNITQTLGASPVGLWQSLLHWMGQSSWQLWRHISHREYQNIYMSSHSTKTSWDRGGLSGFQLTNGKGEACMCDVVPMATLSLLWCHS